ncbi:hypothetical protein EDD11_010101 [Mortierella claussenii]|nr:hypothetical protein EDD11_010101 [Mortierella claussenii]
MVRARKKRVSGQHNGAAQQPRPPPNNSNAAFDPTHFRYATQPSRGHQASVHQQQTHTIPPNPMIWRPNRPNDRSPQAANQDYHHSHSPHHQQQQQQQQQPYSSHHGYPPPYLRPAALMAPPRGTSPFHPSQSPTSGNQSPTSGAQPPTSSTQPPTPATQPQKNPRQQQKQQQQQQQQHFSTSAPASPAQQSSTMHYLTNPSPPSTPRAHPTHTNQSSPPAPSTPHASPYKSPNKILSAPVPTAGGSTPLDLSTLTKKERKRLRAAAAMASPATPGSAPAVTPAHAPPSVPGSSIRAIPSEAAQALQTKEDSSADKQFMEIQRDIVMIGDTPTYKENKYLFRAAGELILRAAVHILSRHFTWMTRTVFMLLYREHLQCPRLRVRLIEEDCGLLDCKALNQIIRNKIVGKAKYFSLNPTYFQAIARDLGLPPLFDTSNLMFNDVAQVSPIRPMPNIIIRRVVERFDEKLITIGTQYESLIPSHITSPSIPLQDMEGYLPYWHPQLFPSPHMPAILEANTAALSLAASPINYTTLTITPEYFLAFMHMAKDTGMKGKKARKILSRHAARTLQPLEEARIKFRNLNVLKINTKTAALTLDPAFAPPPPPSPPLLEPTLPPPPPPPEQLSNEMDLDQRVPPPPSSPSPLPPLPLAQDLEKISSGVLQPPVEIEPQQRQDLHISANVSQEDIFTDHSTEVSTPASSSIPDLDEATQESTAKITSSAPEAKLIGQALAKSVMKEQPEQGKLNKQKNKQKSKEKSNNSNSLGYLAPSGIFTLPRPDLPTLPGRPAPYDEDGLMISILEHQRPSRNQILERQKLALENVIGHIMTLPMNLGPLQQMQMQEQEQG